MSEIEAHAERVLANVAEWVWDGETLPVPVEEIADTVFGLKVREGADLAAVAGAPQTVAGQALSGLLFPDRREIWIDAEEAGRWPGRRRFTICHELGHWCLHRRPGTPVFCRHGEIDPDPGEERAERPAAEEEADAFAAALLMPAPLVRAHYPQLKDRMLEFVAFCELFGASGAAMGRRLHAVIPRA